MRHSQEQMVLKGDVREGPVHQDHLCVLNVLPELQQQEHSPAVQIWGQRGKPVWRKVPHRSSQPQGHSPKCVPVCVTLTAFVLEILCVLPHEWNPEI